MRNLSFSWEINVKSNNLVYIYSEFLHPVVIIRCMYFMLSQAADLVIIIIIIILIIKHL